MLGTYGSIAAAGSEPVEQRVDRLFDRFNKPASPGCALGVIRNGNFVYRKGYGSASLELAVPLSSSSVFYMGSISKQFTATSVVLAAEKGLLALDDDVHKYLPELPDYGQPVTLRQMLHHTSGLRDINTLLGLAGRSQDGHSTEELIDLIAHQKDLDNKPGTEFRYSNSNYLLLGEIIKRTTKKPLSEFAAENIFRPLGMAHTRFYDDSAVVVPGRVPAYSSGIDGNFRVNWSTNYTQIGAGGLMSSVDDLLLWDRNFYDNRLGTGTLLHELLTPGLLSDGQQFDYALGLQLGTYRGSPIVEHSGALFGYSNEILRFPQQRFTVICLCNVASANPVSLSYQVADIYLASTLEPVPPKPAGTNTARNGAPAQRPETPHLSESALGEYAGTYVNDDLNATYNLFVQNGALMLRIGWNPLLTAQPVAPDEFAVGYAARLRFNRDDRNRISGVNVSYYSIRNVKFEKRGAEGPALVTDSR